MAFEVMEDCIHLKACRRIQAIGRKHRLMVPRYCTSDCTAYVSGNMDGFLTLEDACYTARSQYSYYGGGHDPYDVFCSCDFPSKTIGEIINEIEDGDGDG